MAHREVERKVRVPEDFALPPLGGIAHGVSDAVVGVPVTLVAAYYDTPDLRLLRWGVSLRRREGGLDEGWHLKLPASGQGVLVRDELALPLGAGSAGSVPPEMADLVRALVREAPLVPVVTIRTRRAPCALLDGEGLAVAEVVDDRVEIVQDGAVVAAFREIEVEALGEQTGRAPRVLAAVVAALVARGGVSESGSKVAEALAPGGVAAPDVVVPPWPRAQDPAGETIRCILATNVRALLLADVAVRRDLPDSAHQMRVAARTLRSALRTFARLLDDAWATDLRTELAWAADAMGTASDAEVFLGRLETHADQLLPDDREHAVRVVDAWLRDRLVAARGAALFALRSDRYLRLLTDLVEAARAPRFVGAAGAPAAAVFPDLVQGASRRLIRAVEQLTVGSPPAGWHRARILAKRARYAAEATAPVLGEPVHRRGAALERVTELLGDLHDAVVARQMLRELASWPETDGLTGYALGLLDGIEAEREREEKAAFAVVWPKVHRVLDKHPLR